MQLKVKHAWPCHPTCLIYALCSIIILHLMFNLSFHCIFVCASSLRCWDFSHSEPQLSCRNFLSQSLKFTAPLMGHTPTWKHMWIQLCCWNFPYLEVQLCYRVFLLLKFQIHSFVESSHPHSVREFNLIVGIFLTQRLKICRCRWWDYPHSRTMLQIYHSCAKSNTRKLKGQHSKEGAIQFQKPTVK